MKQFLKIFIIAFLCLALALVAGFYTFFKFYDPAIGSGIDEDDVEEGSLAEEIIDKEEIELTPLEKAIKEDKRVNILLLGVENQGLSDTMIFASLDKKTLKLDLISIPRDTYFHEKGYDDGGNRKLNAKHGRSGPVGLKRAVENILKVPIHHYVSVKYSGVEEIVDTLGGVEVDVPFHMKYEDPTDSPPLYIDIPKGRQVLNGEKAIQFLRFRKGINGSQGYVDGDLGRIKTQQQFLKQAAKKALSYRLPWVAKEVFENVKTDMKLSEILDLVPLMNDFDISNIDAQMLPGRASYKKVNGVNLSYFLHDPDKIEDLMHELYNVGIE